MLDVGFELFNCGFKNPDCLLNCRIWMKKFRKIHYRNIINIKPSIFYNLLLVFFYRVEFFQLITAKEDIYLFFFTSGKNTFRISVVKLSLETLLPFNLG